MAKNWMMNEAAKIFAEGSDKSAMQDIGFRYPLTSRLLAMLNPAGVELVTDGILSILLFVRLKQILRMV